MPIDNINKMIGERLRAQRVRKGLSQKKMGDLHGISFQQVQKYEKGRSSMSSSHLYNFAQSLGVGIEYLFKNIEELPETDQEVEGAAAETSFVSNREFLELMKSLHRIKDPLTRKSLTALIRSIK